MKKIILIAFIPLLLLLGAFQSNDDHQSPGEKEEITWYSMEKAQQLAGENGKKVVIYAEAEWCGYCKKMEKEVFTESTVIKAMNEYYYPVRVDIESDKKLLFNEEEMTGRQFARAYRVSGTPTTFFVDSAGEVLGGQPGFIPADVFEKLLTYIGTDAFQERKFEEYMGGQEEGSGNGE